MSMRDAPNIVWIYCDELRADALGCYGHTHLELHTPNLDRLAESGVRFTNHFCNSPVCVSSRVCTLTGLHPEGSGVYNNEGAWRNFRLPRTLETFPEVFARHGYATADFGKLHLPREMQPFQVRNGEGGGMRFWQDLGEEQVQMIRSPAGGMNGGVWPDEHPYPPDQVTANALKWMDSVDGPYLLRISLLQPHTPVLPPAKFVRLYEDADWHPLPRVPEGVSAFQKRIADVHGLDRMPPDRFRAACLHYYAQVAWIDSQVGEVLEFLEARGQSESTIILFGSDHGNPLGDTGQFEKHTFAPSVHRVPFLLSWPGTVPGAQVRDGICDSLDLPRTLFAPAGIEPPSQFKGRDLLSDPAPAAIYSTIGFGQPDSKMGPNGGRGEWFGGRGWPRRSCVRTNRYRLDKNMLIGARPPTGEDVDLFLADVENDPEEVVNLASDPTYTKAITPLVRWPSICWS